MNAEKKEQEGKGGAFFVTDENGNRSDRQLLEDSEPGDPVAYRRSTRKALAGVFPEDMLDRLYGKDSRPD